MELDEKKLDEVVLALLHLNEQQTGSAWKGFPWEIMDRLHEAGWISNPQSRAKSVFFSDEGGARAKECLERWFGR